MTWNGKMAVILCYSTEFSSFGGQLHQNGCSSLASRFILRYAPLLYKFMRRW